MVAFGNRGWWAVQMSIVSSQIGFCCAYIIFIMHNASTLIDVSPNEILVLLIGPLMFLANIRDLSGENGLFESLWLFKSADCDRPTHTQSHLITPNHTSSSCTTPAP